MSQTRTGPGIVGRLGFAAAVAASHTEAICRRLDATMRPVPAPPGEFADCPLCGGPMIPDQQRAPRDQRRPDGTVRRLPHEVLHWFRCARCHQSQIGIPDNKVPRADTGRPAA